MRGAVHSKRRRSCTTIPWLNRKLKTQRLRNLVRGRRGGTQAHVKDPRRRGDKSSRRLRVDVYPVPPARHEKPTAKTKTQRNKDPRFLEKTQQAMACTIEYVRCFWFRFDREKMMKGARYRVAIFGKRILAERPSYILFMTAGWK